MRRNPLEPDFKKVHPRPLYLFRDVSPSGSFAIPELSQNRKCTDVVFLIVFTLILIAMIGFSFAVSWNKDIRKFFYGVDSCGNTCGTNNFQIKKTEAGCKPMDYTNYPVLLYTIDGVQCIKTKDCKPPQRELLFGRCFPTEVFKGTSRSELIEKKKFNYKILHIIKECRMTIMVMFVISAVISFTIYGWLRWNTYVTLVSLLSTAIVLSITVAFSSWFMFLARKNLTFSIPAILSVVIILGLLLLFLFLCNRFLLLARLYLECVKTIFHSPILLAQPLLTTLYIVAIHAAVIYILLLIHSNEDEIFQEYPITRTMYVAFSIFMIYWLFGFANGCQSMIVSGVIASHHFTRDKSKFRLPYFKSFWNTVRFHLGTVAAGSLVITILRILKPISEQVEKKHNNCFLHVLETCCEWLREMAEYLSRKAYVMTAMHGKNIYQSGRRAVRLLWFHLCDTIFIDYIGCVTMHSISLLIIFCSLIVGLAIVTPLQLEFDYIPLLIGVYFAGIVSFFYASLMNVTIETLVLCFCEDRLLNTGGRYSPFFMTPELFSVIIQALEMVYYENNSDVNLNDID